MTSLFSAVKSTQTDAAKATTYLAKKMNTATATARKSYKSSVATTTTENGDTTNSSSGSKVLDLFSKGGAVRNFSDKEIIALIKPALKEELNLAVACIFYLRDVLEGQGERRFFRVAIAYLANNLEKEQVLRLIELIPMYGRWDDLFALRGTSTYATALEFYASQISKDVLDESEGKSISLAAKWAPSEKAGTQTRIHWKELVAYFPSPRTYRLIITKLRNKLNIIETKMCADAWQEINYSAVPSRANLIYRKAFKKHDGTRYGSHIEMVLALPKEERKRAMKSGTLMPYELVHKALQGQADASIDAMWASLPDFTKGKQNNSLAIVDTSCSMNSGIKDTEVTALSVAISLGLYLAENATGIWEGKFITFSDKPTFVEVKGATLTEKVVNMSKAKWDMSTNLRKVFNLILTSATKVELPASEMPETLYIISDMQFNRCADNTCNSTFDSINQMYEQSGYVRPNIVFWNVMEKGGTPAKYMDYGIALVSGLSATTFANVLGDNQTPETFMRNILEGPRYELVRNAILQD